MLIKLINRVLGATGLELKKQATRHHGTPAATLKPAGTARGKVLLSYIPDAFTSPDAEALSHRHTHYWESSQIAATFLANEFSVDVVHYDDANFVPREDYDILVSARTNLERLARLLPKNCLKIAHLDTAHFLTNNANAYARLASTRERRGVALRNLRMIEQNWALESADIGCVLGNDFTADSYRYAGKPIYRIPISCTDTFDWPEDRDFEQARSHFMWFGSAGFVHKGLDLVLEAFRELPELSLTVCGPMESEIRFAKAFHDDLYETPNIATPGWTDVTEPAYVNICRESIATIYPSCAEGGGGSVLTCMHAGLIPVVTRESSVDVGDFGIVLADGTIGEIKAAALQLASMTVTELENRARASWEYARAHHTQESFTKDYAQFVANVVMPEWKLRQT
jgi:glycosyltransferase involved in cell wall biosynthesis